LPAKSDQTAKLGGQAGVPGVAGTWKDLTDSVNSMAGNLTPSCAISRKWRRPSPAADLSRKITVDVPRRDPSVKETLNTMVDQLNRFAGEVTRVAREVAPRAGGASAARPTCRARPALEGPDDSVNSMAGNLTAQVRNIAEVTTAVARGDLSRKITVDVKGEILELKNTSAGSRAHVDAILLGRSPPRDASHLRCASWRSGQK